MSCADKGAQLCSWSEWSVACKKNKLTDVQFGTTLGKYEWIDDYTGDAYQGIADPRVYSDCEYLSRAAPKTPNATTAYRCCSAQNAGGGSGTVNPDAPGSVCGTDGK